MEKWFLNFWERVSLVFQIIAHVNRTKDLDWKIKYSSQWIGITDNLDNVIEKALEAVNKELIEA